MKRNNLIKISTDYITQNRLQYLISCVCLLSGIVIGSLSAVSLIHNDGGISLRIYFENFISAYSIQNINRGEVFIYSIYNNIKVLLFIWLSGLWIGFIPFGLLQIGIKGFKLGFTVAFVIVMYNLRGILFSLCLIIPQIMFMIPILLTYVVFNINFAFKLHYIRKNGHTLMNHKNLCYKNLIFLVIVFVVLCMCSFIDAFVTPTILKGICNTLIK